MPAVRITADFDHHTRETTISLTFTGQEVLGAPPDVREMWVLADTPGAPLWEKVAALAEIARAAEEREPPT